MRGIEDPAITNSLEGLYRVSSGTSVFKGCEYAVIIGSLL